MFFDAAVAGVSVEDVVDCAVIGAGLCVVVVDTVAAIVATASLRAAVELCAAVIGASGDVVMVAGGCMLGSVIVHVFAAAGAFVVLGFAGGLTVFLAWIDVLACCVLVFLLLVVDDVLIVLFVVFELVSGEKRVEYIGQ